MISFPTGLDDRLIWDTWLSIHKLPVVTVADEIGLFGALSAQEVATDALASALSVNARALRIHLGALAAMSFVEMADGDRWRLTATARATLCPDSAGYYGQVLRFHAAINPLHLQLMATLRTGSRAADHISSTDKWESGQMSAEAARRISGYMNVYGSAAAPAAAQYAGFASITRLLDVGGGSAIYAIALARAWPQMRATVLDIEAVCAEARRYVDVAGLSARIDTLAHNMLTQDWPTGFDAHFLSNILHDWEEETCRKLAAKSFQGLPTGGRIILHEMPMDDDGCGPLHAALFSLVMLLGARGRQYSVSELKGFLSEAGFANIAAEQTSHGYFWLITAQKP